MYRRAFTLVEMLFVLSIVMILMLLVIPQVTLLDVIDAQIQLYEINEGDLPSSVSDLIRGGYIDEKQGVCPNGKNISISHGQAYSN